MYKDMDEQIKLTDVLLILSLLWNILYIMFI